MTVADISLLEQDRILLLGMASTALMTLILTSQKLSWFKKRFSFQVAGALLLGGVTWWWLQSLFTQDTLPLSIVWWMAWAAIGVSTAFTTQHSRKNIIIAIINACIAVLFALMLANQYYQFFPTIGSLFEASAPTTVAAKTYLATTPSNMTAAPLESTYTPPANEPSAGKLVDVTIPGDASHFHPRASFAYIPPAALGDPTLKLPVLVGLSGVPGSPGDWSVRIDIQTILDNFATKHKGLAPIVVIADQTGGNGFVDTACVDSSRGNVETYLTKDVPAYIKQRFSVYADSSSWAIGGFSDGGMCSMVLGLRHPDVYRTFVSLSGTPVPSAGSLQQTLSTFFGGSLATYKEHDALAIANRTDAQEKLSGVGGQLIVGRDEQQSIIQANHDLFDKGKALGLDMVLEVLPGHHSFGLWKQGITDTVPWLAHRLGLISCGSTCK